VRADGGRGAAPLRVLYFIDSLGSGGAQRQLVTLVSALDRAVVSPEVAVYHGLDRFRAALEEAEIPVHRLGRSGGRDVRTLVGLVRLLRIKRFDLVHSYLRTPGILARLARAAVPSVPIVVSERSVDLGQPGRSVLLERLLSGRAEAMIANAEAVRRHIERLVPTWRGRVHVVPNGLAWCPPTRRHLEVARQLRAKVLAGKSGTVLGVVGRFESPKNPHLLLDALELLPSAVIQELHVLWVGAWTDQALVESVKQRVAGLSFGSRVHLLCETSEVRSVYRAVDVLVLPSDWEGFPNVVLEALAEERLVISTDVGDVRLLVRPGRTGWVVPPRHAAALASAIREFLCLPKQQRTEMGRKASVLVREEFSVARLVDRTLAVYETVLPSWRRMSGVQG